MATGNTNDVDNMLTMFTMMHTISDIFADIHSKLGLHVQIGRQTIVDTLPEEFRQIDSARTAEPFRTLSERFGINEATGMDIIRCVLSMTGPVTFNLTGIPEFQPTRPTEPAPNDVKPFARRLNMCSVTIGPGMDKDECYAVKQRIAPGLQGRQFAVHNLNINPTRGLTDLGLGG